MHIRLAAALNDRTKNNPCPTDQLSTDSELVKVAFYKDIWMDQLLSMHKCLCLKTPSPPYVRSTDGKLECSS
jgi:hypothetical protein